MTGTDPDLELRKLEGRTVDGRYVLREFLGAGAFGGVFRSDQLVLGRKLRTVAVKLSKRVAMTEEEVQDVLTESFLLGEVRESLKDPDARRHLVDVYDAGLATDTDGRGFVVTEFVQGTTLARQFADQRRVPPTLLLNWAVQICRALAGLHTLDPPLLHRDLKPDNVLLGTDLTVRLVDFGLAAKLLDRGGVSGVAGTLAYMAPETSRGESVPASDVYSLGLLLYEGLTGTSPFAHLVPPAELPDAWYPEWLYDQKRDCVAMPPSHRAGSVSTALDGLVLRCLEFTPERRWHDASELMAALDRATDPPTQAETALADGGRLQSEGDARSAVRVLERGLQSDSLSGHEEFRLLRELGEALLSAGDPEEAARQFARAWKLARNSAFLRTRAERAALLTRTADAYQLAGNEFQARRYRDLGARERGAGRG